MISFMDTTGELQGYVATIGDFEQFVAPNVYTAFKDFIDDQSFIIEEHISDSLDLYKEKCGNLEVQNKENEQSIADLELQIEELEDTNDAYERTLNEIYRLTSEMLRNESNIPNNLITYMEEILSFDK